MLTVIIAVVAVSGCIHTVETENNQTVTDIENQSLINDTGDADVTKVNKTGNIQTSDQSASDKIKKDNKKEGDNKPKISKSDMEKEIVRIMKLENPNVNYTAKATLIYQNNNPVYVVDVYDDFGWYAYLEVDATTGPEGNDNDGYAFLGGAVRGETGDEPDQIDGVMPKLSVNDAREIMDKQLKNNYSLEEVTYTIIGYLNDSTPHYNISIEKYNEDTQETEDLGIAYMNADTGEIIYINMTVDFARGGDTDNDTKIYSVDEAGAYVDIIYKGKKVSVRENYPYYSPQDDKVFYSQEEEAEWLYNDPRGE